MEAISAVAGGVRISVLVQPRAGRTAIAGLHDGRIRIRLAAPPVDGAANDALVRFLAKRLGVSRGAVALVAGQRSRRKTVTVAGVDVSRAAERLDG